MRKPDYKPNRLKASVKAIKEIITTRSEEDAASMFSVIRFAKKAEKANELSNLPDEIFPILDNLAFDEGSALGDALGMAIKLIIEELRKVAALIPKILLISDGIYTQTAIDPIKMAHLAKGLNIKIDCLPVGTSSQSNILKKICDLTGGKYLYNNDTETLIDAARSIAKSNVKRPGVSLKTPMENPAFLRQIAANLLRVQDLTKDQEQLIKQIRGEVDYKKCSICFSEKNPYTGGSFFVTGRYCPKCNTPFHIHCLSAWGESQQSIKLKDSGTARCPHCFYLLKIPTEITQAKRLRILTKPSSLKLSNANKKDQYPAIIVDPEYYNEKIYYGSCPVCNLILVEEGEEGEQDIVRCGNPECETSYHRKCFESLHDGRCKSCSVKLTLNQ